MPSPSSRYSSRWLLLLALLLLLLRHPGGALLAQQGGGNSEEEERRRREQFLRAREQMRALPPSPSPNKPAAKPTPAPAPTPSSASASPPPGIAPGWGSLRPAPRQATPPETPSPPQPAPTPAPTAPPSAPASPRVVVPFPSTGGGNDSQQPVVVIEKSGQQEDESAGEETPPPPPPKKRGFFARLFGLGRGDEDDAGNYRYLTRRVLAGINGAGIRRGRWKYTVVHNSGTRQGSARIFDYYHRHTRHMPNGMAYHFVIGNGTSTGDGQIEIGERWRRQINGGHVHSDYLNNIAIGICLVGDFNRDQPTRAQYAALDELITYLRKRVGRIERRLSIVKAHKEINPVPTDCPGNRFSYSWLHRKFD